MVYREMEDYKPVEETNNIKEGYMFVQGNVVWKPWSMKARYFILTSECLYCFKRRGDLDAIPSDVLQLDGTSVTVDEERRGMRKRYYIRLTSTQQRKSFNLFCFMAEERNSWMTSVLSILAKKYTEKGFQKAYHTPGCKTVSLLEEKRQSIFSRNIEQSRAMSISCMELTNLSVIPEPMSPAQTAIPIRKTFDFSHIREHQKKISSGSLDLAFRTDTTTTCGNRRPMSSMMDISLNTREYYGTQNRNKKQTERTYNKSKTLGSRMNHKRVKSMSDLLERSEDLSPIFDQDNSCHSTPSQKRKRKGLSLGMFGTSLNFRTVSMANLF